MKNNNRNESDNEDITFFNLERIKYQRKEYFKLVQDLPKEKIKSSFSKNFILIKKFDSLISNLFPIRNRIKVYFISFISLVFALFSLLFILNLFFALNGFPVVGLINISVVLVIFILINYITSYFYNSTVFNKQQFLNLNKSRIIQKLIHKLFLLEDYFVKIISIIDNENKRINVQINEQLARSVNQYNEKMYEMRDYYDKYRNRLERRHNFINDGFTYIYEYKDILSDFKIYIPQSMASKILKDRERIIKDFDKEKLYEKIRATLSEMLEIDSDILELLYYDYNKLNRRSLWSEISQDKVKLAQISQLILDHSKLDKVKITKEHIIFLSKSIEKFDLSRLIEIATKFYEIFEVFKVINSVLKLLNLDLDIEKVYLKLINSGVNLSSRLEIIENIVDLSLNISSVENYKSDEDLLKILIIIITNEKYPEDFQKDLKKLVKDDKFCKLFWQYLKLYKYNFSHVLIDFKDQKKNFSDFIEQQYLTRVQKPIKSYLVNIFKENLKEGKLIIEEERLFAEYYRNLKSGSDIIENVFSEFGGIDFKYLLNSIFNKISNANFLQILSYEKDYVPFLLAFDNAGADLIDSVLNTFKRKEYCYWEQYTRYTRIGLVRGKYKNLQEFKRKFEVEYSKRLINTIDEDNYNDRYTPVSNRIDEAIISAEKKDDPNLKFLKKLQSDALKLKKDYSKRYEFFIILKKFQQFTSFQRAKNLIEDFIKSYYILIYKLTLHKNAIIRIESDERFSPINVIKEKFSATIMDKKAMNVGLSFENEFRSEDFSKLFKNFLKSTNFEELVKSKYKIISEINNSNDNVLKSYLEETLGKTGTLGYLEKSGLTNLYELSDKIIQEINLGTDWNRDLYEKNITNIQGLLVGHIRDLVEFWEEKTDNYYPKESFKENEKVKALKSKFEDIAGEIMHYILYTNLVVSKELFLLDLSKSKEESKKVQEKLKKRFGEKLYKKLNNDIDFKEFLIRTVQFILTLMEYPIFRTVNKKDYEILGKNKLEKHFQYRLYEHYRRFLGEKITRESQIHDNKMDLLLNNYPIEIKMRKSKDWDKFVDYWIGQISEYCTTRNSEVGFFIAYDNVDSYKPENYPVDFFEIKKGKVKDMELGKKTPKVVVVRIPNFSISPSKKVGKTST